MRTPHSEWPQSSSSEAQRRTSSQRRSGSLALRAARSRRSEVGSQVGVCFCRRRCFVVVVAALFSLSLLPLLRQPHFDVPAVGAGECPVVLELGGAVLGDLPGAGGAPPLGGGDFWPRRHRCRRLRCCSFSFSSFSLSLSFSSSAPAALPLGPHPRPQSPFGAERDRHSRRRVRRLDAGRAVELLGQRGRAAERGAEGVAGPLAGDGALARPDLPASDADSAAGSGEHGASRCPGRGFVDPGAVWRHLGGHYVIE